MPTSYTAPVQAGKISTLAAFAMLCARQFGATLEMRDLPMDAPIPERFEPSAYYFDRAKKDALRLKALQVLSPSEAQRLCQQEYAERLASWKELTVRSAVERVRYEAMLALINASCPPSPGHVAFWTFMRKQIEDSITFDCDLPRPMPRLQRWPDWLKANLADAEWDVARSLDRLTDEMNRTTNSNAWLQALREELGV